MQYRQAAFMHPAWARWLEIAPEHVDPFVVPWSMCTREKRIQIDGSPSLAKSLPNLVLP